MWAGTYSFRGVGDTCLSKFTALRLSLEEDIPEIERAASLMFPAHIFSMMSIFTSIAAKTAWIYHSPYAKGAGRTGSVTAAASDLDLKRAYVAVVQCSVVIEFCGVCLCGCLWCRMLLFVCLSCSLSSS